MAETQPKLYRVQDVMEQLSVSRATVYRLVGAGKLRMINLGRKCTKITAESVDALLAQDDEHDRHSN
jgi:excisionase family DNA binding protein